MAESLRAAEVIAFRDREIHHPLSIIKAFLTILHTSSTGFASDRTVARTAYFVQTVE